MLLLAHTQTHIYGIYVTMRLAEVGAGEDVYRSLCISGQFIIRKKEIRIVKVYLPIENLHNLIITATLMNHPHIANPQILLYQPDSFFLDCNILLDVNLEMATPRYNTILDWFFCFYLQVKTFLSIKKRKSLVGF